MQDEKDIFNLMKKSNPKRPSEEFIVSTGKLLRKKARGMKRKWKFRRLTAVTSGFLLFAFAFSWFLLLGGKDIFTNVLSNPSEESLSTVIQEEETPLVYIYHTHNYESYIPELNINDPKDAFSDTKNITLVGKELSKALEENNIKNIHDHTDIAEILQERNLKSVDSYKVSRENLQKELNEHKSINMVFDIHRDSIEKPLTTIKIGDKDYARILFVVSETSDNFEENSRFANLLHEKLEESYPGLSRGVLYQGGEPKNTYNQDLKNNSVLLNIGGIENTLEESYRTTHAFAEVIKEIVEMDDY